MTTTIITTLTLPVITHTVSPASTGKPNYAHGSKNTNIAIEVGVPLAVIAILITVVMISCVTYRKLIQFMHIVIYI